MKKLFLSYYNNLSSIFDFYIWESRGAFRPQEVSAMIILLCKKNIFKKMSTIRIYVRIIIIISVRYT